MRVIQDKTVDLLEEEVHIQKEVSENMLFKKEIKEVISKGRSSINKDNEVNL